MVELPKLLRPTLAPAPAAAPLIADGAYVERVAASVTSCLPVGRTAAMGFGVETEFTRRFNDGGGDYEVNQDGARDSV